jgi:deazaflavin-dependent oxidoreductase (nitroreductase family)
MSSCVYREAGAIQRTVRTTAATRPLAWLYARIQQPLDQLVYRLSRGRTTLSSSIAGVQIVMLTTTGARSAKARTVPVLAIRDGATLVLIASNFGRARNPSWYHNLLARPRAYAEITGEGRHYTAREMSGEERDRCYRLGAEIYPGFHHYVRWTARRIPVLRLEPDRRREP